MKNAWYVWMFLCSKIALLPLPIPESNRTCMSEVFFFFCHKLLFRDVKLSDLGRRNRKLSAHDCTEHIKTPFSSDNYHKTRNINMSQPAVLLVPGHNHGYMGTVLLHIHNVLSVFQLKAPWRL